MILGQQIKEIFERQVIRTPEATAVSLETTKLTYKDLNTKANQLARYLLKKGITENSIIAICLEPSLQCLVSLLALIKLGITYIPIDLTYPEERINYILCDSEAPFVISSLLLEDKLKNYKGIIFFIEDFDKENIWETEEQTNTYLSSSPNRITYIVYTSGSTGNPKGVLMPEAALISYLEWQYEFSLKSATKKILQNSSFGFDIFFQECFTVWLKGGELVLITKELKSSPQLFLQHMDMKRIDKLILTFSAFVNLINLSEIYQKKLSSLREVIVTGEPLIIGELIENFLKKHPNIKLFNLYGASEVQVVTIYEVPSINLLTHIERKVPLGSPVPNIDIYILDEHKKPVANGMVGELYVGGKGIAKGYLKRPELTAEKFIPNPFIREERAYLYKTGDLVKLSQDGDLEYFGRFDNQVKIRGYRIELSEIEAIINQSELVDQAAACCVDEALNKKIIVYIVLKKEAKVIDKIEAKNLLYSYLKHKLPDYMIPSGIIFMSSLPLTPNGKIDKRVLSMSAFKITIDQENFSAPRTELEEKLAELWSEILHVNPIDIHDNFFELGGDSLLLTILINKIQQKFLTLLSFSSFLEHQTVAGLAELISSAREGSNSKAIPVIARRR